MSIIDDILDDRTPPKRVRFEKLQEVHIAPLLAIDRAAAEEYWALGFDAAEVPVRTNGELYRLPKNHAVHVAEADYVVAGYSAFRDESPGVAYLEEVSVHPDYRRFGIGRQLIERVFEEARAANLKELVLRRWDKAEWAVKFYEKLGFRPIDDNAPERVRGWLAEKTDGDRPFLRPGESALWVAIPKAAPAEEEPEDEDASDGEPPLDEPDAT
jgi:ribosomal protein S18 acetylase RimI-like enzyme